MGLMRLLRVLGGVLSWIIGVAAVAALASVAINSAGQQVVARTITVGQSDGLVAVTPTTGPTPSGPSPSASLGPAAETITTTSARPKDPSSSPATAGPTTSGTTTRSASPTRTPSSTPAPTPTPTPTVTPMSDVRVTSGGAVWVECTGPVVTDALAQPSDGWSAHTGQRGPGDLEALFVRSNSTAVIQVTVVCVGGQPRFAVASGSRHGDD
ncbi:MAG TPA: hypothetical protein VFP72_10925 [Kineosporiaceae bacterium]|nr:hypothetical protein [Kineosporiaceae bacterium]